MSWVNYADVLRQLDEAGIVLDKGGLLVDTDKTVRCHVKDDKEKRGWYRIYQLPTSDGGLLLTGAYGVWIGDDNGSRKITLPKERKDSLSKEQLAAIKASQAKAAKQAEAARRREVERCSARAAAWWSKTSPDGASPYLQKKGITGLHGARLSPQGNLIIPIADAGGKVWGLQVVYHDPAIKAKKGRDKEYAPRGLAKQGHFHLIGSPAAAGICIVVEGFATGASVHEATGLPVAVAFDAGNLLAVGQALQKAYKGIKLLFGADDDHLKRCHAPTGEDGKRCHTWNPHDAATCAACAAPMPAGNAGVTRASAAALQLDGRYLAPVFRDPRPTDRKGPTDWNDLHQIEGLLAVRAQLESYLLSVGWLKPQGAPNARHITTTGGGGAAGGVTLIESIDEFAERFSFVYGMGGTLFDHAEHRVVSIEDALKLCRNRTHFYEVQRHPNYRAVRHEEVGFDPTGADAKIKCNLWSGWPTVPAKGSCERLLELLQYMCAGEEDPKSEVPQAVYQWVLKWIALPIQRPGAKMKTAIVLHGPQGTGKNMFFDVVRAIYGKYGRLIDQNAMEDKFNDFLSAKLFIIANEVVASSERYHVKNILKGLITDETIRINPKNVGAWEERNHANLVFLSNELIPVALEESDRRYAVIWTPPKLGEDFYQEVKAEIEAGGVEALHHHLLNLDLAGFSDWTKPPATKAKSDLIDLCLPSSERFFNAWTSGEASLPVCAALTDDLYAAYRTWTARVGIGRPSPLHHFMHALSKRPGVEKGQERYSSGQSVLRKTVLIPPQAGEMPFDTTRQEWIGEQIARFATALDAWRQDNN